MIKKTALKKVPIYKIPPIVMDPSAEWIIYNDEYDLDGRMVRVHKILERLGHKYLTGDCDPPTNKTGYIIKKDSTLFYGITRRTNKIKADYPNHTIIIASSIR